MNYPDWRDFYPAFEEKTKGFLAGEVSKNEYKGFSGFYGVYGQKGGKEFMLRLRMTAGRITMPKMKFIADSIDKYDIKRLHFTTCEAVQVHDLPGDSVGSMMLDAWDAGIITVGGGGDFPRNVMCSPLSGLQEEYFDVTPYAEKAGEFLLTFVTAKKMPRKLKVCFSNSPANVPHATFRDLGFVATPEGKFDVYSAGGLGNNPKFGIRVAEGVDPSQILYYIKAMYNTFCTYGNYENRGKARTRYMQEILGGEEGYKAAYLEKLQEVLEAGEDLTITVEPSLVNKKGDGSTVDSPRAIAQKQDGLYSVIWHPIGGQADVATFAKLYETIKDMEEVELRLSPDETAYIINLTGAEAQKVMDVTAEDSAASLFEMSTSCIGASTCQVGLRDSQALLAACIQAVKEAGLPCGCLPAIHISGCPSSCATHQTALLSFRGGVKKIDGKMVSAFLCLVNGNDLQGQEMMAEEVGIVAEAEIPAMIVEIGKTVAESGMDYMTWSKKDKDAVKAIIAKYL